MQNSKSRSQASRSAGEVRKFTRKVEHQNLSQKFSAMPVTNADVATVVYHKREVGSCRWYFEDIKSRSSNHRSYDLLWRMPGHGISSDMSGGVLAEIGKTTIELENVTNFVLYIRMQRPFGYKTSPASYAGWETIGKHKRSGDLLVFELKPRSKIKLQSLNRSTPSLCPRQVSRDGKSMLHMLSLSVFRDPWDADGNMHTYSGVALSANIEVRYKSSDGKIGKASGFTIEVFDDCNRLDKIDPVPSLTVPINSLYAISGTGPNTKLVPLDHVVLMSENAAIDGYYYIYLKGAVSQQGVAPIYYDGINGLDETTYYMLPSPAVVMDTDPNKKNVNTYFYLRFDGRWKLCTAQVVEKGNDPNKKFINLETIDASTKTKIEDIWYLGGSVLTPVSFDPAHGASVRSQHFVPKLTSTFTPLTAAFKGEHEVHLSVDVVVKTIIFVIDVIHLTVAYAAAIGFLDPTDISSPEERPA